MINSISSANVNPAFGRKYIFSVRLPKDGCKVVNSDALNNAYKSMNKHYKKLPKDVKVSLRDQLAQLSLEPHDSFGSYLKNVISTVINYKKPRKVGTSPFIIPFAPNDAYYNFAVNLKEVTPEVRQMMLNVEHDLGNAITKTVNGKTERSIGSVFIR